MTKPLVNQPSSWPTRKLITGAMVAAAGTEAWGEVMATVYPPLAGQAMSALAGAALAVAVGYFIRDRANT